jgi:hypothetical protein
VSSLIVEGHVGPQVSIHSTAAEDKRRRSRIWRGQFWPRVILPEIREHRGGRWITGTTISMSSMTVSVNHTVMVRAGVSWCEQFAVRTRPAGSFRAQAVLPLPPGDLGFPHPLRLRWEGLLKVCRFGRVLVLVVSSQPLGGTDLRPGNPP